ncbi:MAG: hypothetical protein KDD73_17655, partial [Anaerolineales bacterium]|nr:hypothetical protein [Anaerolineales bacterium]
VADLPCPPAPEDELETARKAALKAGKNRPAAQEAIRLIGLAATAPFAEALAEERRVFQEIRVGSEARALRHIFFAEREAPRVAGLEAKPDAVTSAGVIGAGTMGAGIAYALLRAGVAVTLVERDVSALKAGVARVEGLIGADLTSGRIAEVQAESWRAALTPSTDLADAAATDLVIEAVFEDMGVKSELLAELGRLAPPETL